jgi:hypothetical protein
LRHEKSSHEGFQPAWKRHRSKDALVSPERIDYYDSLLMIETAV